MAKKNTQQPQEQFKTMIGGQALIEGIMMLGPEKSAVVVRTKDGLQRKVEPRKLSQKWSPKKLPFIRGIFNFCTSMKTGVSALMYSADFFAEEDEDEKGKEPGRFEAWLEKRLSSEKAQNALITFSVVLGLAFSIALFFVLPSLLGSFLNRFVTTNEIVRNLLEGLLRIVIFLAYMFLVSRMKDMRRVFSYHGAEHKTIRCYEAKLPLTVENARKMTRLHPRCGTSFLFVVMIVSILVFSLATPLLRPLTAGITSHWLEALVRVVLKLLLLPIVVGISYEFNRLVGRHDNWLTRALSAPGMWLQYLTTNEPDDSMLEVGIEALTLVLPEKEGEFASNVARELICAASGKTAEQLISDRDLYASEEICELAQSFVRRRVAGEPMPYILGDWDFYGMTLTVTPDVLIPRDDTMAVTELAIK